VAFESIDLDVAVRKVTKIAQRAEEGIHVHLLNAYSVALADSDSSYLETVSGAAINFPDGKPLTWISRIRRDTVPLRQIRGVEFFLRTFDLGTQVGLRHFLLGSTPETLELLRKNLEERFPEAEIVGSYSPPFRLLTDDELAQQDRMIESSGAHLVWVGLGTPKQDFEVARLASRLPVAAVAVGAAFDFAAGTVKEAPSFVAKIGFEWLYRLCQEPRRLWRRYLFGNARFLRTAIFSKGLGPRARN
jgi:N-acetylglucosaminyldiphosphoundecaprenol N-acetyl-beta-D-mannosaminyltransferase